MQDGKWIGILILDYFYNSDLVMWICEDWMKKFNLKVFEMLVDFEVIMEMFMNKDLDGNGKKDIYGLIIGFKNWFSIWMFDVGWVFGVYGMMLNQWNLNVEGKLEYGFVNLGVK